MYVQVNGLVVSEASAGECNRNISLLTDKKGIIKVFVKGAKSMRSKNACASQMFSYSNLILYKSRSGYIINEAEINEVFAGLRKDIYKLSLAQHFCEIMLYMAPKEEESRDYLRLILNSFAYLENDKMNRDIIKSIFEMRVCTMAGYMPDLTSCRHCKEYKNGKMYFSIDSAFLICENCLDKDRNSYICLESGVLDALRHIVYSPIEKLFSFKVSVRAAESLSGITERYLINNSYIKYKALDFYNLLDK